MFGVTANIAGRSSPPPSESVNTRLWFSLRPGERRFYVGYCQTDWHGAFGGNPIGFSAVRSPDEGLLSFLDSFLTVPAQTKGLPIRFRPGFNEELTPEECGFPSFWLRIGPASAVSRSQ